MLTRQEFEDVFETIIFELTAIFEGQSSRPIDPTILADLSDQLRLVQEMQQDEERVAAAFAIVNQYLESTWSKSIDECYRLYRDKRGR